jgi:mannose-6-phosphate isomerase-like protein (cupin superfamily)
MPRILDIETLWQARTALAENELRRVEIAPGVKLNISRRGAWPKHVDDEEETYLLLRGELHFETDTASLSVRTGQIVTFEAGEAHAGRTEVGAISLGFHGRRVGEVGK